MIVKSEEHFFSFIFFSLFLVGGGQFLMQKLKQERADGLLMVVSTVDLYLLVCPKQAL